MFASLFRSKAQRPKAKPKSQASAPGRRGPAPEPKAKEPLSKKARKRLKAQQKQEPASKSSLQKKSIPGDADAGPKAAPKRPNSVLGGAAHRLKGSRFRWLNESLYTMTGKEALKMFTNDPSLAEAYHEGFRAQASKWPRNPLDGVISWLRKEVPKEAVIGDFGCGDARLALELSKRKVHSFDLVKINERVTACNLAHVPLPNASLDVAVFCLALMGTDWIKFVEEAHRCLKPGGLCHIVEVESRFADVQAVVRTIESVGFQRLLMTPGSFFVELRFKRSKSQEPAAGSSHKKVGKKRKKDVDGGALLGACTYRKR